MLVLACPVQVLTVSTNEAGMSQRLREQLEKIVQRCGLSRGAGHPLWRWRVRQDELTLLRSALRDELRPNAYNDVVCAAFCLFAAHYFCRNYEGGPWTWEIMTEPLGWTSSLSERYRIVRKGLAYWGRKVMRFGDSNEYLVTLICEGGLPLRVVAENNQGRVRRWFREVLRLAERYELPAAQAAVQVDDLLPLMLRNDLVRETGAELIDRVIVLRREVGTAGDPASRLDAKRADWRQELPVEIEQSTAREFINGLLKEPSVAPSATEAPRIITTLNLEGMRLERSLELPRSLQKETIAEWLDESDLPVRLSFYLTTDDGMRMQVAIATKHADQDVWRVEQSNSSAIINTWPIVANAIRVSVTSGARELGAVIPAGGDPLSEELPWIFEAPMDGRAKLLAIGSVRTAAQAVLVATPRAGNLELEPEGDIENGGAVFGCERDVVRLRGTARWVADDARCVIRSNSEAEENAYMVAGLVATIGCGGREAYRGHPPIVMFERGIRRLVATSSLRWRAKRGVWRSWAEPGFGDIRIRVVEDGEVYFETQLTVIPKDFEIHSKVERAVGAFQLKCKKLDHVAVTLPDGTRLSTGRREGDGFVCDGITVEPDKVPRVHVHLRFRDGGETILPMAPPRPFIGFVRFDGAPIGQRVSLEDLPILRARALVSEAGAKIDVEARRRGFGTVTIARLIDKGDGFHELALDSVRAILEALHVGNGIDDTLELRIVSIGFVDLASLRALHVVVRKEAFEPTRNEDGTVDLELHDSVRSMPGALDPATLRVEARPIERYFATNVNELVLELPQIAPGRWRFDSGDDPFEPWLVTAWHGGFCRLRPIRVKGRKESQPDKSPLVNAMRTGVQSKREELIVQVLRECAENGVHEDWDKLKNILRTTTYLPPATFDVVRLMAQVPETAIAALALIRRPEERIHIWRGFERLDFLWETVPVVAWVRAARCLVDRVRNQPVLLEIEECLAETYVARLMSALLNDMQKSDPFVNLVREVLAKSLPLECKERNVAVAGSPDGRTALEQCIGDACKDLMVNHADDNNWPTVDALRLAQSSRELERAFNEVRLRFDFSSYTRGVIDAPTLAAAIAVTGVSIPSAMRLELRRFRAFDQTWFQQCHAFQLALLLSSRISSFVR